jgi:integrase
MSVRQRPAMLNALGQPAWIVDYKDEHGRRKELRTDATSKKDAQVIEAGIKLQIEKAKALGVTKQALSGMTFSKFVDEVFLPAIGQSVRESTYQGYSITAKDLNDYFGSMLISSIEPLTIDRYFETRHREKTYKGTAPGEGTLRNRLNRMNQIMKFALRKRLIQYNPVEAVNRRKYKPAPKAPITKTQEEKILNASQDWLKPILTMGIYGGMRVSEILGMQWEHIQNGLIFIPEENSKNHKARWVPISSEMEAALAPLQARRLVKGSKPYVFWNEARQEPYKRQGVYTAVKRIAGQLGIDTTIHATRVTFITDARESGKITDAHLMAITGHADARMLNLYTKVQPEHLKGLTEGLRRPKDATQTRHVEFDARQENA